MKKHFLQGCLSIALTLCLTASLQNCSNSGSYDHNEDKSNPSGNNNPSNENSGNHANEPHDQPGTNYPAAMIV